MTPIWPELLALLSSKCGDLQYYNKNDRGTLSQHLCGVVFKAPLWGFVNLGTQQVVEREQGQTYNSYVFISVIFWVCLLLHELLDFLDTSMMFMNGMIVLFYYLFFHLWVMQVANRCSMQFLRTMLLVDCYSVFFFRTRKNYSHIYFSDTSLENEFQVDNLMNNDLSS